MTLYKHGCSNHMERSQKEFAESGVVEGAADPAHRLDGLG